jgi:hypothetical protein
MTMGNIVGALYQGDARVPFQSAEPRPRPDGITGCVERIEGLLGQLWGVHADMRGRLNLFDGGQAEPTETKDSAPPPSALIFRLRAIEQALAAQLASANEDIKRLSAIAG